MGAAATSVAGLTVAKATRDTLFVATYPVAWLPYALIATGLASAICVSLYTRLTARASPRRIAPAFPALFAAAIAVLAILLARGKSPALVGVLYVALTVGSSLTVSGFWALLSESIDVRAARKSLATLTLMSSIGGFAGALVSSAALGVAGPGWLLPVVAIMNAATAALLLAMARLAPESRAGTAEIATAPAGLRQGLKTIAASTYLRDVAIFVTATAVAGTLGDYLMKSTAAATLGDEAALAKFFVTFHGVVAGLTLAAQLLIAQPMLERRGLTATLSLLPGFLVAVSLGFAYAPILAVGAGLRGGEMAIRNSAHKAAYELVFVPLSSDQKRRTRAIFDTLLDRLADGIGALVLIGLIAASSSLQTIALVVTILGAAAMLLIARVRRGYVESLTARLAAADDKDDELDPAILSEVVARQTIQLTLNRAAPEAIERLSRTSFGRAAVSRTLVARGTPPNVATGGTLIAAQPVKISAPADHVEMIRDLDATEDLERVRAAIGRWNGIDRRPLPSLVQLLGHAKVGGLVQQKLIAHVDRHVGALSDELCDPATPLPVRRRIPRVLAESTSKQALAPLIATLDDLDPSLRFRAGRALRASATRGQAPEEEVVWIALRSEITRQTVSPSSLPAPASLGESTPETPTRHMFNLLALVLPPRAIDLAHDAVHGDDPARRAVALEYLENVLPPDVRASLFAVFGQVGTDATLAADAGTPSRRAVDVIIADLDRETKV